MSIPDFFTKEHNKVRGKRVIRLAANGTVSLPKGVFIDQIYMRNRTANAVTGGIRVGTVTTGVDIVAAQAVAGVTTPLKVAPLITGYLVTARTLFIEAVTSWNSAVVDFVIEYTEITTRTEPTDNLASDAVYK